MEVSGKIKREKQSSSIENIFCSPCLTDNRQEIVSGYCVTCNEYLCSECATYHRRFGISRNHVILEGTDIAESKTRFPETYKETCSKHTDEFLKYFCIDHEEFCCGSCILDHRYCKLDGIENLARNYQNSKEFKYLITHVKKTKKLLSELMSLLDKYRTKATHLQQKALADINTFHEHICKCIGQKIDDLRYQVNEIAEQNKKELNIMTVNFKTTQDKFEEIQKQIRECHGSDIELFMKGKLLLKGTAELIREAEMTSKRQVITEYLFKPSKTFEDIAKDLNAFGGIMYETHHVAVKA